MNNVIEQSNREDGRVFPVYPKDQSYVTLAKRYLGQKEIVGVKYNSWIKQLWYDLDAKWLWSMYENDDSKLPWCGGFLAKVFSDSVYPIPDKFWSANSWAKWGMDAGGPLHGAVAVLKREGGGHVTLVTGITADGKYFRGLGGNQGDAVTEAWFPVDRVTAWRLPSGNVKRPTYLAVKGDLSLIES